MRQIITKIKIKAPKEIVWKEFTDTTDYPNWNPFIKKVWGNLKKGSFWELVYIAGPVYLPLPMKVDDKTPNKQISWSGNVPWILAIFSFGQHIFTIEELSKSEVVFSHRCILSGLFMDIGLNFAFIKQPLIKIQNQMLKELKGISELAYQNTH